MNVFRASKTSEFSEGLEPALSPHGREIQISVATEFPLVTQLIREWPGTKSKVFQLPHLSKTTLVSGAELDLGSLMCCGFFTKIHKWNKLQGTANPAQ